MELRLLLRKGSSFYKLGKRLEAIETYEKALKLDPENEKIRADLD